MFDRSVNKVVLIGNLGKDPEIRHMQSGSTVASLTLATTSSWKDKQSGERRESTEWHRLSVFNRLGELCGQYIKKGNKIYIEGRLKTNKWKGQDGSDRYTTEIVVSEIEVLDSKNNDRSFTATDQNSPKSTLVLDPVVSSTTENLNSKIHGRGLTPEMAPLHENTGYARFDFEDDDIPF